MNNISMQPVWLPTEITEDMAMAGYNAMRDPATNLPAPWVVLGTAFKVFEVMVAAAPPTPEEETVDLFKVAVEHGLQIFSPDAEPNAVVRWYPWTEQNRVSADSGDCAAQGLPISNYNMTRIAIRKALVAKGVLGQKESLHAV